MCGAMTDRDHTAIGLGDHQILGHRQPDDVSGNRSWRLQCVSARPFTGTWGGDDSLEYVQTFTEVGGNRRFDDRAHAGLASDHA